MTAALILIAYINIGVLVSELIVFVRDGYNDSGEQLIIALGWPVGLAMMLVAGLVVGTVKLVRRIRG